MEVQVAGQGKLLQRAGNPPQAFIVVRQGVVRVQDRTTTAAGELARRWQGRLRCFLSKNKITHHSGG